MAHPFDKIGELYECYGYDNKRLVFQIAEEVTFG